LKTGRMVRMEIVSRKLTAFLDFLTNPRTNCQSNVSLISRSVMVEKHVEENLCESSCVTNEMQNSESVQESVRPSHKNEQSLTPASSWNFSTSL
jgi:hypothetical protein